jgi:hypothetical protein
MTGKRLVPYLKSAALGVVFVLLLPAFSVAQNQVMGELQFSAAAKVDKDSGIWIDGQYVGYLKELKGNKKIMLLPGKHEVMARQAGYADLSQEVTTEPGTVQILRVRLTKDNRAFYPGKDAAELKLDINPDRAAVFVDDTYAGHAGDFGGSVHTMLLSPGKHRIKVELPGYQTFETEVDLLPMQKSKVATDLVSGSIEQAGSLIKN